MKIAINITEDELKDAVLKVIKERYYRDFSTDRRHVDKVVAECVRQIIYADKEILSLFLKIPL